MNLRSVALYLDGIALILETVALCTAIDGVYLDTVSGTVVLCSVLPERVVAVRRTSLLLVAGLVTLGMGIAAAPHGTAIPGTTTPAMSGSIRLVAK